MKLIQNEALTRNQLLAQFVPSPVYPDTTINDIETGNNYQSISSSKIAKVLERVENVSFNISDPVDKCQTYNDLLLASQDLKLNYSRNHLFGSNSNNIDNNSKPIMPPAVTEKEKRKVTAWLKEFTAQYGRFLNEVDKLKTQTNDGIKINTYQMANELMKLRNSWIINLLGNAHNNTEAEKFWNQFSILKVENHNPIFVNVDALFKPIIDALGYDSDAYNRMVKFGPSNFKDRFENKEFLYSDEAWSKVTTILQNIKKDFQYASWEISGDYPIVSHDKLMEKFIQAAQNMDSQYVKEVEKAVTQIKAFLEEYANLRNELAKMTSYSDGKRVIPNNLFRYKLDELMKKWDGINISKISSSIKKEFWERFPILKVGDDGIVKINSEYLLKPSIDVLEKLGTPWKVKRYDSAKLKAIYDDYIKSGKNFSDFVNDNKWRIEDATPTENWSETEWLQVNTALDNASRNLNSEISSMANAYSTAISDSSRFYNLLSSFIEQLRQADLEFVKSI